MLYNYFKVGSGTSEKQVVVYDKSKELEQSNKTYIAALWRANGLPFGDADPPVFRCELRMRSEAVKEMVGFTLEQLQDPKYLLSLFRTGCKNFFEFCEATGDANITRERLVNLIPFDELGAVLLQRARPALTDGRYKAKMAVHLTVKDSVLGILDDAHRPSALGLMQYQIEKYELSTWFRKRLPDWVKKYSKLANSRAAPPGTDAAALFAPWMGATA